MFDLTGKVALVTGASRGVGKGVALGLGEARATVYVTARSTGKGARDATGNLAQTVDEVKKLGGKCIAIPCDPLESWQTRIFCCSRKRSFEFPLFQKIPPALNVVFDRQKKKGEFERDISMFMGFS